MTTVYLLTCDLRAHDNPAYDAYIAAPAPKYIACIVAKDVFKRDESRSGKLFLRAYKELSKELIAAGHEVKTLRGHSSLRGCNVIISLDTSPYARQRLKDIEDIAKSVTVIDTKHLIPYTPTEKPYKVYSGFYKSVIDKLVDDNIVGIPIPRRGRAAPIITDLYKVAKQCIDSFSSEKYRRLSKASILKRQGSTNVSWALARGIVSAREVFNAVLKKMTTSEDDKAVFVSFARELIFRDFYSRASLWWIKSSYTERFRNPNVTWKITTVHGLISAISNGPQVIQTIYKSLVDTGVVSNYGRMLFATWVNDISCDWMVGEALFRKYLLDYDFSSNRWNWAHHSNQGLNYQWPSKKFNVSRVTLDV